MEGFSQEVQLVVFKLNDEEYGIDILQVQEIIKLLDITRVPKAPWYIEGVINLRGSVIPVIDLRKRFHMPSIERVDECRVIVLMIEDITVGIIVDAVNEVLRLSNNNIESPPDMVGDVDGAYVKGIGKIEERLITILDVKNLIAT